ncbi:MAG: hypothetical protein H7235_10730 [Bdellovibrionaceae bacterium]|nr:hypothetical protein [Pseudobdellovibrionaceae bacterium]
MAKKNIFQKYFSLYLDLLAYFSLLTFFLMITAGIILCFRNPYDWSFDNLIGLLTFSRDQIGFRASLIVRINPLGLFTDDISNVGYIGPQLIIQPLLYTLLKISGLTKSVKQNAPKSLDFLIYTLLGIAVMVINTRAFALILVAFLLIRFVRNNNIFLKKIATILLFIFPFGIFLLSSKAISLRNCQFDFVKSHLSPLGNGIGFDVDILNNLCSGGNISVNKSVSTLTFSYDNIHLEFIHYFGYLAYLGILVMIFLNVRNNKRYLYLWSFIFIFLALNFNLFEVVLAPIISVLFFYTYDVAKQES